MATAILQSKLHSHLRVAHGAQNAWRKDVRITKKPPLVPRRDAALLLRGPASVPPVFWNPTRLAPATLRRHVLMSQASGPPSKLARSPSVPAPKRNLPPTVRPPPQNLQSIRRTISGALSPIYVERELERAPSSKIELLEQLLNQSQEAETEQQVLQRRHSSAHLVRMQSSLAPWDEARGGNADLMAALQEGIAAQRRKENWHPSFQTHPEIQEGENLQFFADTPRSVLSHSEPDMEHFDTPETGHFDPLGLGTPEHHHGLLPQNLINKLHIPQAKKGLPDRIQDMYQGLLKQKWPAFLGSLLLAPAALSAAFTALYLLDPGGLAMDDSIMQSASASCEFAAMGAQALGVEQAQGINFFSFFEAFMMSFGMSTGVDPVVHAVSPYTMVVAQLNGMSSQLVFVLLSGAVFARFSQPAEPVVCSKKAVITGLPTRPPQKMLALRYAVQQELVDVKVDVTVTRTVKSSLTGGWVRTEQPLNLVRSGAAYQTEGMVVQHIVDKNSPLYGLSSAELRAQDVKLTCSIVGLERASLQSVVHIEEYSANEGTLVTVG